MSCKGFVDQNLWQEKVHTKYSQVNEPIFEIEKYAKTQKIISPTKRRLSVCVSVCLSFFFWKLVKNGGGGLMQNQILRYLA